MVSINVIFFHVLLLLISSATFETSFGAVYMRNMFDGFETMQELKAPLGMKFFDLFCSVQSKTNQPKNAVSLSFFLSFFFQGSVTAAFSPKALENPRCNGHDGMTRLSIH